MTLNMTRISSLVAANQATLPSGLRFTGGLPPGRIQTAKKPTTVLTDEMKGVAKNVRAAGILNELCAIPFHCWFLLAELAFRSLAASGAGVTANDLHLARPNLVQRELFLRRLLGVRQRVLKWRNQSRLSERGIILKPRKENVKVRIWPIALALRPRGAAESDHDQ